MSSDKRQTILITAAAQGIGFATAVKMSEAGYDVYATDIDPQKLSALAIYPRVRTQVLDVLDNHAIQEFIATLPTVDVLFNCAGVVHSGGVLQTDDQQFEAAWQFNVMSQIHMIQAVLPGMVERGQGCIINMSSIASSLKGVMNRCAYSVSKAAVIGLTKSVAADYISQGIRCNAICPGTVETPSLQQRLQDTGDEEMARRQFIQRQPMGRIGQATEIADLVHYLAQATFTTGQAHHIDGGWSL